MRADFLQAADRRGLLDLRVNEIKKGEINVVFQGDDILTRVTDLEQAGLVAVGVRLITIREIKYVSLKSLGPNVKFRLDETDLSLRLTVKPLPLSSAVSDSRRNEPKRTEDREATSVLVEAAKVGDLQPPDAPAKAVPTARAKVDQAALFDLRVNGIKKAEAPVILRAADVAIRKADLEAAGLVPIDGKTEVIRGEEYVSLASLAPVVTFELDENELVLHLTIQPSALGFNRINLYQFKPPRMEYREDTSGFINYALNLRDLKRFDTYGEAGLSFKNSLLYSGISRNADGFIVRGLSNFTISQRESLNRTMLGDRLVASDVLGGNLILGGISYFREFAIDPYFARNPGLHYSGAVATPSTVDVYVNGLLMRRVQLPAGQFELRDLPVPAGSADTRFVLRDAFGREQEFLAPFYFTSGLLKQGLHEFSYDLGVQRENFATESWHYGAPVFIGRHRVGVTDALTAGLRFEASPRTGIVSGGPSVSFLLPLGEMELTTAVSQDQGIVGSGAFLGYSYGGPLFNFGSSVRFLSPHYATTSLRSSDPRSWLQLNTILGFSVAQRTGVSLRYTLDNSQKGSGAHRINLSTTTRLMNRLNLFVRGGYSRKGGKSSNEVASGLIYLFGDISATLSYEKRDQTAIGTVSVQKPLPTGTGFGYLLQASANQNQFAADNLLQYQGPYGRYEAYYGRSVDQNSTLLSAAGGFVFLGGGMFATRPVQESFALIRVPGLVGIRGYTNNLEVGYSDSKGNLLVPNLLPYYGNKLSISDKDIPLNYNINGTIQRTIATPYRGGAIVIFPVERVQRVTGTIVIGSPAQATVPAYGQLTLIADGKQFESPIGRQGEFYLENVPAGRYQAVVEHGEQSCEFSLDVPQSAEEVVALGTLRCLKQ